MAGTTAGAGVIRAGTDKKTYFFVMVIPYRYYILPSNNNIYATETETRNVSCVEYSEKLYSRDGTVLQYSTVDRHIYHMV